MGADDFYSEVEIERKTQKKEEEQLKELLDKAIYPYKNYIEQQIEVLEKGIEENTKSMKDLQEEYSRRDALQELMKHNLKSHRKFLEDPK